MVKNGNGKWQYVSTHTGETAAPPHSKGEGNVPFDQTLFRRPKRRHGNGIRDACRLHRTAIAVWAQTLGGGMRNLFTNVVGTPSNVIIPTPHTPTVSQATGREPIFP